MAISVSGMLLRASKRYILFTFCPVRMMVPLDFWIVPLPFLKVVVRPALSKALIKIKLTLSVGVWRAWVYVMSHS